MIVYCSWPIVIVKIFPIIFLFRVGYTLFQFLSCSSSSFSIYVYNNLNLVFWVASLQTSIKFSGYHIDYYSSSDCADTKSQGDYLLPFHLCFAQSPTWVAFLKSWKLSLGMDKRASISDTNVFIFLCKVGTVLLSCAFLYDIFWVFVSKWWFHESVMIVVSVFMQDLLWTFLHKAFLYLIKHDAFLLIKLMQRFLLSAGSSRW